MPKVIDYETAKDLCGAEGLHKILVEHGLPDGSPVTVSQLMRFAQESKPARRGYVACFAPYLSPEQREELRNLP